MTRQRRLALADKKYIWHPFTQMQDYQEMEPVIIERGEGSYLFDVHGRRYLDGVSSLWVTVHGHRRAEIDQAVIAQVGKIAHSTLLGLSNPPAIELAERLVEITPAGLTRVFYSDNGSTGCEVALKMAFQYWQHRGENNRKQFISFKNAYHGDTVGALSVGGIDLFHETFRPLLFPVLQAEAPYCYRCPLGLNLPACGMECLTSLERILRDCHEETAALIIEPLVQGAAGMITQPPGFLSRVRELCTQYEVLMIADEVAVGFGRTGRMFACEHEGVSPDMLVLAKGITGGYLPLAATLTTEEIYDAFLGKHEEFKTFFHGHTYTGNPVACAAALANLDIFKKEETIEQLAPKIALLARGLERFKDLAAVGEVRQRGVMVGVELVTDKEAKTPFAPGDKVGIRVILEARKRGVIIRPLGDVIVIMPPLGITAGELEELIEVIYQSIKAVTARGGVMIDCHTHIFSPYARGNRDELATIDPFFSFVYADQGERMVGVEELLAAMEEGGVEQSVVCGSPWQGTELVRRENDYLLESAHKYPQQIIPFITLPQDEGAAIVELERCGAAGARGVGELAPGTYGDHLWPIARMRSLFAAIREKRLPILIHVNEPVGHPYAGKGHVGLTEIEALINALKGIPTVLAHWGGGFFFYELMPEIAALCREVYYDTAASPFLYHSKIYTIAVAIIGFDRIVFGSDYPLIPAQRYRQEIEEAGLTEAEQAAILSLNAQRLLRY